MANSLTKILVIIGLLVVAVATTWLLTRHFTESKIEYTHATKQKQLDSLSVVSQNLRASRAAIEDSLSSLDENFSRYVTRTNQQIASYSTIIGRLRLEKDEATDSVKALQKKISLADLINQDSSVTNTFRDTLVTRTETWSDSLFAITALAQFQNDSLLLSSRLERLRDIRIDVVTTVSKDHRQVNTFVRSPDFDSLQVTAVTEIRPKPSWVAAASKIVAAILVIKEAINLIK